MAKIKLAHTEVEVKALLEVLGVYVVLALVLVGVYYLGPAITGFVTVTKEFNYTDEINLEFGESSEFMWDLSNPGNLKSIKIDGSKSKWGEAKVYIESNGIRYLIFDSSRLVENPSGMFGITGFVAAEDNAKDNDKDKEPNHPPVWGSSSDKFVVNGSLTVNLNDYFNDKDNDTLTYSASELKTNDLEILLENEMLTINNKKNIRKNRILEIIASDNETSKKKNVVLVLIGETVINETVEKAINVNLKYGDNEVYDANNDGVESLIGVIDFSVDDSDFNWAVDEDKLCTRYEIFSVEAQESTFACFGNSDCCALVDLGSSRDLWNDKLFLSYGGYGSSTDNIVFAQVLYADYSLNIDDPYSEIVYSSWDNLTAKFVEGIIEFENICIDTCMFSGNESSYKLVIEAENTTLWINKIKYLIEENVANNDPVLLRQIENISVVENGEYILDLSDYFSDGDNDELAYSYSGIENITIRFENNLAYIVPDGGFVGGRFTFITADDSFGQAASNVFKIDVNAEVLSIEIVDSRTAGDNWTIGFSTTGTGNLTISAISGSTYSEMYNDNASTVNDLDILELRCGDFEIFDKADLIETEGVGFILMNGSKVGLVELIGESLPISGLYIENYNCNDIGYYTVKVSGGASILRFNFSNEIKNVGYEEVVVPKYFEIRSNENENLAVFDDTGNLRIKGNLTQNIVAEGGGGNFVIYDSTGGVTAVVTNPEGNMQIKGVLNENQGVLLPTQDSLVIQNKNNEVVAYVNAGGSLFLKGTLTESASFG